MISATKLPFLSVLCLMAQIRANLNIMLLEHYDQLTQLLMVIPKLSLMFNAIRLTLG
ncbi:MULTISPECIES: hypothetical protein [Oscillatoriales]|uniref:Uncharacterized protein n=1 Tax=Limnospira platensis NIES-46 TaxID=1236695 RepID=A0A5M3T539_LIMPL|nr:hypothetical protein [Arthrospira platensis]MDF2211186.1 hypothetical protein [Arthrospira platensis NCB002]WAK74286.1 hypothetical protein AP9108_33200 [Arthrospira sp. PCC 9108]BDT11173.1 hypothetical protein N39L_08960 [Arthrospira platensis NIES-39]GCE94833.1 hypothetical protein NIES46_28930 [Arthrospira platensis NIES-46]